jgi:3-oxoadipate enol-lactonase
VKVKSGRATIYYELKGPERAPALLLIRGLGRTRRHWGPVLDDLTRHFRLILMDNRGVGSSSAPWPPYTTRQMADDAARVLTDAGIERAHVCGISLGGMIAQEFALRHPKRVDRLVLGCTRAGYGGPPTALPMVARLFETLRLSPEKAVEHTAPLVVGERFAREHPEVIAEWQALARAEPPRLAGLIGQLTAAARHEATRRLPRIACPTLVVTGDVDRMIPPGNSEIIARAIPGARLRVLSGAPHDFVTVRPRETSELLAEFLLDLPARRSASDPVIS